MTEFPTSHSLQVIDGAHGFGNFAEWNSLVQRSSGGSFFQTAQWCTAWADHLANPESLAIARVTSGTDLVGAAALAVTRHPLLPGRLLKVNVVTIAGTGSGAADHCGFPILAAAPPSVPTLLWQWATRWREGNPLLLANLDRDTKVESLAADRLDPVLEERCPTAVIPGDCTYDELIRAHWTKNRRKTIGKKLREFARLGGLFRWVEDTDEIVRVLPRLYELHLLRRSEIHGPTTFGASSGNRAFHNQLASYADGSSGCWVQLATVEGEIVGALYGFRLGTTYSVYQSGWDPAWSSVSLGLIQYAEAFRSVVEQGGTEFDMCRGMDAYKLRFATEIRVERSYGGRLQGLGGRMLAARWAIRRARLRRNRDEDESWNEETRLEQDRS